MIELIRSVEPRRVIHSYFGAEAPVAKIRPVADFAIANAHNVSEAITGKIRQKSRLGGICEGDHWTFFFVARLAYPDGLAEALLFQRAVPEQSFILSDQNIGVTIACEIDKA